MTNDYRLFEGDCLTILPELANEDVKVDLVLTDPPYGTTQCKWDSVIPFDEMWDCINRLSYPTTPTCLFSSQPYTTPLNYSNINNFKYEWIWDKKSNSSPLLAKKRPMKYHEIISVFYKKQPKYNYEKNRVPKEVPHDSSRTSENAKKLKKQNSTVNGGGCCSRYYVDDGYRYARSVINHINSKSKECRNNDRVHPTQKPVELLEYLIKTYTNEGDIVLDFTMGSGSTGVACANTGRRFIGIELEPKYYKIASERIKEAYSQTRLDIND